MPPEEGLALYQAGVDAAAAVPGAPLLEVGSYCGKSSIYLGAAARDAGTVLIAVDHHRGSEENQPGWEWHEPDLVDEELGAMDTLPFVPAHAAPRRPRGFGGRRRRRLPDGVGSGPRRARSCSSTAATGRSRRTLDYGLWTPHVAAGGLLAIHDVFEDPADGGRPPYEQIYLPAIDSGRFVEIRRPGHSECCDASDGSVTGSRRPGEGARRTPSPRARASVTGSRPAAARGAGVRAGRSTRRVR